MVNLTAKLVVFAYPDYVLVDKDGNLPHFDIRGDKTSSSIVKDFFQSKTGVYPDWPSLIFHQDHVIEDLDSGLLTMTIVWSLYLEGLTQINDCWWAFKKIDEKYHDFKIIREVGQKRYV